MIYKFAILIFVIGASSVLAAGNVCKTGNILNRPGNNQSVYWPTTWRENQTSPILENHQTCSWVVTIPEGYFARLVMSGRLSGDVASFQIIDMNGYIVQSKVENMDPYYFPYPKFTLIVTCEINSTFAFKIDWATYPVSQNFDGGIGPYPVVYNVTARPAYADIGGYPGISLLAFPADSSTANTLRSVQVFEGTSYKYDGKFVNNLYELYKTPGQWMSPGSNFYISSLEARNPFDQIAIQDYQYTKDINPYLQLLCKPSSTCSKSLNGGNGKSGIVYVGTQKQTLVAIKMETNATLSVYWASPPYSRYAAYNGSTIQSLLPLTFVRPEFFIPGTTQFVISSGKSEFTFKLSD